MNSAYNNPQSLKIQKITDNYKPLYPLGGGGFGDVVLAKSVRSHAYLRAYNAHMYGTLLQPLAKGNQSHVVAVKTLKTPAESIQVYGSNKELKFILNVPSHPNLIQVYEILLEPVTLQLHIVMEFVNQSLLQHIITRGRVRFSDKTMKSILSQLLSGIKHIHKHEFFHRDIKPENVLMIPTSQYFGNDANIPPCHRNDNYIVKVSDYGLSRSINSDLSPYTEYVATRWYRAPEMLLRRKWYSKPVDIWGFGVVAAELINFVPLFQGKCELDQIFRIFKTLGCPSLPNINSMPYYSRMNYFIPLGGFWREAVSLAYELNIQFPYEPGLAMDDIIPTNIYKGLPDVIKACLTWDPDIRADANYLCSLDYFKGTPVYEPRQQFELKSQFELRNQFQFYPNSYDQPNYFYDDFDDGYEKQFMNYNTLQNYNASQYNSAQYNPSPYQNLQENLENQYDSDIEITNANDMNNYTWRSNYIDPNKTYKTGNKGNAKLKPRNAKPPPIPMRNLV